MRKTGVAVSKKDFMEASMKFDFAGRTQDRDRAAKLNDEASRLLGFADYAEFEEFHEGI